MYKSWVIKSLIKGIGIHSLRENKERDEKETRAYNIMPDTRERLFKMRAENVSGIWDDVFLGDRNIIKTSGN